MSARSLRELVVRDDRELRRVEQTIATLQRATPAAKLRNHFLYAALLAEREELLKCTGHGPSVSRREIRLGL